MLTLTQRDETALRAYFTADRPPHPWDRSSFAGQIQAIIAGTPAGTRTVSWTDADAGMRVRRQPQVNPHAAESALLDCLDADRRYARTYARLATLEPGHATVLREWLQPTLSEPECARLLPLGELAGLARLTPLARSREPKLDARTHALALAGQPAALGELRAECVALLDAAKGAYACSL